MEEITIQIKGKTKTRALLNFLKTLDFIENISSAELSIDDDADAGKDEEFLSLAGMWENREVTIDSIRQKGIYP